MVLVDVIRSALAHLGIDRCPRCLEGELIVDVARARVECSDGCTEVAEAIGECARRLTNGLKGEGESLSMFCRKASRRTNDEQYIDACKAAAYIEAIVQEERAAS